jgi:hypothetical protein
MYHGVPVCCVKRDVRNNQLMTNLKKPYTAPKVEKLLLNKAKLILQNKAAHHDLAAKELLDLLLSKFNK